MPSENFCAIVNGIITWRTALGDAISMRDYMDFGVPQTESDLNLMVSATNRTFESFGMDMRVGTENGVIIPRVKEAS